VKTVSADNAVSGVSRELQQHQLTSRRFPQAADAQTQQPEFYPGGRSAMALTMVWKVRHKNTI